MTISQEPCGDTCSVVSLMASTFKEFVPRDQRIAHAIAAVQSGKLSQRAAARKFDLDHSVISRKLKAVANATPAISQSEPQKQPDPTGSPAAERSAATEDKLRRTAGIRNLARANGMGKIDGKFVRDTGAVRIYNALTDAGIDVPDDIKPRSLLPKQPKASKPKSKSIPPTQPQDDTNQQRISSNNSFPVLTDGGDQTDPEPTHPAFADEFDLDAVRERVNHDVQQSNRPADFKRAIELLTELDRICTDAWYRRHPEPWGHDDWAHVSSEIEALHSIVGQRAEETADELLRKSTAVEVISTVIN